MSSSGTPFDLANALVKISIAICFELDVLMSMIMKGRVTMLDLFQYDFMQRALLAMVAMSLFSPVLGIFLILRRQSLIH